jgi:hypothetical protein
MKRGREKEDIVLYGRQKRNVRGKNVVPVLN